MNTLKVRPTETIQFSYHTLRTISSPDDTKNGRKVYCGHAPARAFLNLKDNENVRTYLVDAEGKKRKSLSEVHREIRETLTNRPEDFPTLNGGMVIIARSAEVDDKKNIINLTDASIINGSQTKGELAHYIEHCKKQDIPQHDVHAKFEIIVTDDDVLIAEISIARNFQNNVARLSIVGRLKQLDDLENSLQSTVPDIKLRKSETDRADDFYDSEKLIQVITALMPNELWAKTTEKNDPRKSYTYAGKSKCLKEFQDMNIASKKDEKDEKDELLSEQYDFFINIAPVAYELYEKWKSHQGFYGSRLKSLERDETGKITRVPDGIIFPILASLSAFIKKSDGEWIYAPPTSFKDEDIIQAAVSQYMETARSNPGTMGKTHSIYSSLYQLTSIFTRFDNS